MRSSTIVCLALEVVADVQPYGPIDGSEFIIFCPNETRPMSSGRMLPTKALRRTNEQSLNEGCAQLARSLSSPGLAKPSNELTTSNLVSVQGSEAEFEPSRLPIAIQCFYVYWRRFCGGVTCPQLSPLPSTVIEMVEDAVRAPSVDSAANPSPVANTPIAAVPTSPSTDTAIGSQRWALPSLKRVRRDSESPTIPSSTFDPEKPSRSTTFALPRRDSTLTTLDELEYAVHGYPRLATFMGHEPGAAIYRRFASLNARILLYRQAELVCLEHELDDLEKSYADQKKLHYSIRKLLHSRPGTVEEKVWQKVQEIDNALERYSQ